MGQYHILANIDKAEVVIPHDIGLGAKQYEHTGIDGSLADAMYLLTMSSPASGGGDFPLIEGVSGRWCGDRVVIVGDYTLDEAIPGYDFASTLYEIASTSYLNISNEVRSAFERIFDLAYEEVTLGNYTMWNRVG